MAQPDPARCPLCGRANDCAVAAGAARCEECWCMAAAIAPAALAALPPTAVGRACVCRACAEALPPAPADPTGSAAAATDPGGRPAFVLRAGGSEAWIARTGGQVLSWRRASEDVLWTGSAESYAAGKAVRGGIPIVFPWFNEHASDRALPAHGFARTADWRLAALGPGARARLTLADDERTRAMWPHRFELTLDVALAEQLHVTLTVRNTDATAWRCEEALHTYFAVGDVRTATVHGLEGVPCREHAQAPEPAWDPQAPLAFRAETDRVFQGVPERLELRAPALARRVQVATVGARSTVVWTPWPAKAARLSGLGPDDWQRFCCVESANIKEATVALAPGAAHVLRLSLGATE